MEIDYAGERLYLKNKKADKQRRFFVTSIDIARPVEVLDTSIRFRGRKVYIEGNTLEPYIAPEFRAVFYSYSRE